MSSNVIDAVKHMHIKRCMYPNCNSKSAIKSHALQNNGVISRLAIDNHVLMPYVQRSATYLEKNKFFRKKLKSIGKNEATTFYGFCKKHDDQLFAPIEKEEWFINKDNEFLFAYRTLCSQLKNKEETIARLKAENASYEMLEEKALPVQDLSRVKEICDKFLTGKLKKSPLSTIAWQLGKINFSYDAMYQPSYDFSGETISEDEDRINYPLFITVLPYKDHSIAFISWLAKDTSRFHDLIPGLKKLSMKERQIYLTNVALRGTDDLVISPRVENKISQDQVDLIEGGYLDVLEAQIEAAKYAAIFQSTKSIDKLSANIMLESTSLNLFEL